MAHDFLRGVTNRRKGEINAENKSKMRQEKRDNLKRYALIAWPYNLCIYSYFAPFGSPDSPSPTLQKNNFRFTSNGCIRQYGASVIPGLTEGRGPGFSREYRGEKGKPLSTPRGEGQGQPYQDIVKLPLRGPSRFWLTPGGWSPTKSFLKPLSPVELKNSLCRHLWSSSRLLRPLPSHQTQYISPLENFLALVGWASPPARFRMLLQRIAHT